MAVGTLRTMSRRSVSMESQGSMAGSMVTSRGASILSLQGIEVRPQMALKTPIPMIVCVVAYMVVYIYSVHGRVYCISSEHPIAKTSG